MRAAEPGERLDRPASALRPDAGGAELTGDNCPDVRLRCRLSTRGARKQGGDKLAAHRDTDQQIAQMQLFAERAGSGSMTNGMPRSGY